ncbi:MAG: 50S ribosomal protein L22 [Candidatus Fischerbacteria bacterium RBG_13_37_8]|uniref:Large ribosomal subunit protein uL22 n=1 Tax=Candidatus Fischerbacteria bacterium RBG_13_37_8 TaxID=1817863 RepID=A0A1F5VE09_9BACT|nr:ribosomal protein L22 [uncultured bacterium]OGF61673.1 MAG: 50S ribosomal protein L22 [Candidatus Fischerbacteria bacterium RBG_13_37_8]
METVSKAIIKYVRISPRKARLVADMVRGMEVFTAVQILRNTNKKGARIVEKAILSAAANARNKESNLDVDNLIISKIFVDVGPTKVWKRFRAGTMGRVFRFRRHHAHLSVFLSKT